MPARSSGRSRLWNYARLVAVNVLVLLVLLVLVEGVASYILLAHDLIALYVPPYRRHTTYDPELGWVDKPNVHIPDLYGPGLSFTTNSAGFRNKRDFAARIPAHTDRVVCTGDSFTLGVGVDDDQTWCHLLTTLQPRLEAVNMGQPGYGVDQAYLLYKRVRLQLDHNAHLFALIGPDIDRMLSAQFQGYDKPLIDIEHGALALRKVPVPRRSYLFPWLTDHKAILNALRAAQLARLLRHAARAQPPVASDFTNERDGGGKTREILHLIFLDLKRLNRERGSELILVFLPALSDFQPGSPGAWSALIREEAQATDVPLIDVLQRLQEMPQEDALKMFILPGKGTYPGVNHLNENGNAFVAKVISEELNRRSLLVRTQ
jgi:hypothetical protein